VPLRELEQDQDQRLELELELGPELKLAKLGVLSLRNRDQLASRHPKSGQQLERSCGL